ncbi:GAF domain-containing protein [Cyclospora cayetanensis]|uniref:GAF domain-containing protein n=1 Tax=Cyclospora cayetanensis TaxID=88456 RepID=A0A1D3CT33_9EIME|nr:GAF domain-containing protein [Cyclospora cayetanensis]
MCPPIPRLNEDASEWERITEASGGSDGAARTSRVGEESSEQRNAVSEECAHPVPAAAAPAGDTAALPAAAEAAALPPSIAASGELEYLSSDRRIATCETAAAAVQVTAAKAPAKAAKAAATTRVEAADSAAIAAALPPPVPLQWVFRRPSEAATAAAVAAAIDYMDLAEAALAEASEAAACAQLAAAAQERWTAIQAETLETALATGQLLWTDREGGGDVKSAESSSISGSLSPTGAPPHPSQHQLWLLILAGSIPFIGFGFVDNFVMIIAGDMFDTTLCVSLGLSTMAAAALGNWLSDLLGIWMGSWIEAFTTKLKGIPRPNLTKEQLELPISRRYYYLGSAIGISLGCLLGMIPLLFLDTKEGARLKTQKDEENFIFIDLMQELEDYMQAAKVVFYRVDLENQCFRTVLDGRPLTLPLDAGIPGEAYRTGKLVNWRPPPPQVKTSTGPHMGAPSIAVALQQQQQQIEQQREQRQQQRQQHGVQPEELQAFAKHLQQSDASGPLQLQTQHQELPRAGVKFAARGDASLPSSSRQQLQLRLHQTALTSELPEASVQLPHGSSPQEPPQHDTCPWLGSLSIGSTSTRRLAAKQILGAPVFGFQNSNSAAPSPPLCVPILKSLIPFGCFLNSAALLQGDVIGVVEVLDPIGRPLFSRTDSEFLMSISSHLAVEFEGKQHMNKILEMCKRQVYSRRGSLHTEPATTPQAAGALPAASPASVAATGPPSNSRAVAEEQRDIPSCTGPPNEVAAQYPQHPPGFLAQHSLLLPRLQ